MPDHTTPSRRGRALCLDRRAVTGSGSDLAIDSTGLRLAKPSGAGGASWKKVHIALDRDSGGVLAEALTRIETSSTLMTSGPPIS